MAAIEINDIKYNTMAFAKVLKDEENKQLIYVAPSGKKIIRDFESAVELEEAYEEATIGAGGGLVQADSYGDLPNKGDAGSIYIAKDTGQEYYWDKATNTYVKVGTAGRTGVYAASVDLNSTIGAATTVNKTDLTVLVIPTVEYSEGSEVVGANATHGLITASTENNVTVKTIPDNTIDSFDQVEDEAHLPQTGQENILYYLKDSDTFRVWDNTNQKYVKPEYLTTSGVNGTNIGTTSNTAINFDTLSKGKHILTNHNYNGNIFYYKYTDVNGTVQSANIHNQFPDSGGIAPVNSGGKAYFNIIEIDMIHTLDELSSLSLYDPVALVTFYYGNKNNSAESGYDSKYIIFKNGSTLWASRVSMYIDEYYLNTKYKQKQDKLVSGTNIKTINNESILGSGNITAGGVKLTQKISTSQETDIGTSATNALDLSTLDVGVTDIINYTAILGSNRIYYKYIKNGTQYSSSSMLTDDGVFSDANYCWGRAIFTLFAPIEDFDNYQINTILGYVTFYSSGNQSRTDYALTVSPNNFPNFSKIAAVTNNVKLLPYLKDKKPITKRNISTSANNDRGNTSTSSKRLDFTNLEAGRKYVYMNYSSASSFYYKYKKPNAGTVSQSFQVQTFMPTDTSKTVIGTNSVYWKTVEVDMYKSCDDIPSMSQAISEPLCKLTFYYVAPGSQAPSSELTYGYKISYYLYKSDSAGTLAESRCFASIDERALDSSLYNIKSTAESALGEVGNLDFQITNLRDRVTALEEGGGGEEKLTKIATGSLTSSSQDQFSASLTPVSGTAGEHFMWSCSGYLYNYYISSMNLMFTDNSYTEPIKVRINLIDPYSGSEAASVTTMLWSNHQAYIYFNNEEVPYTGYSVEIYIIEGAETYKVYGSGYQSSYSGRISNYDGTGPMEVMYDDDYMSGYKFKLSGETQTGDLYVYIDTTYAQPNTTFHNAYLEFGTESSDHYTPNRITIIPLGDIDTSSPPSGSINCGNELENYLGQNIQVRLLYDYTASTQGRTEINISEILTKESSPLPGNTPLDVYSIDYDKLLVFSANGTVINDIGTFALKGVYNSAYGDARIFEVSSNDYVLIGGADNWSFTHRPYRAYYDATDGFVSEGHTIELRFNNNTFGTYSNTAMYAQRLLFSSMYDSPSGEMDWSEHRYQSYEMHSM